MNTVFLHGELEQFGGPYDLEVGSAREAVKALIVQFDGMEEVIRAGNYHVIRQPKADPEKAIDLDVEMLQLGMAECELHIYPAMTGGRKSGLGKIIAGIAMIGAVIITGGAAALPLTMAMGVGAMTATGLTLAALTLGGLALVAGGLASMLAPSPPGMNPNDAETDQKASFLFNGPVNVAEQGHPVPLVYGRIRTGSLVVSADLTTDNILQSGTAYDYNNDPDTVKYAVVKVLTRII